MKLEQKVAADKFGGIQTKKQLGASNTLASSEGEDNPLHFDTVWAKASDFPVVFGLGMHQASILASYAAHWIDPAKVRAMNIRFCGIYWPGDELTYEGSVTLKSVRATGVRTAELSQQCRRNASDVVVQAKMTCVF